eukprot:60838-Pleurochrysis_carterae.AAC.1
MRSSTATHRPATLRRAPTDDLAFAALRNQYTKWLRLAGVGKGRCFLGCSTSGSNSVNQTLVFSP